MNSTTTTTSLCNLEQALETLAAMRRQEVNAYVARDYLEAARTDFATNGNAILVDVDEDCRTKMCEWSLQVVDFCSFSRESVEVCMNLLDRFLLTHAGLPALQDRSAYQLASMSCLYTAVKIHERAAMSPQVVSTLSQGTYSAEQVKECERSILQALRWRVNPPTSMSFVRELLNLMASTDDHALTERERQIVLELAKLQTELAVAKFWFVPIPASTIALASIENALESMGKDVKTTSAIRQVLASAVGIDTATDGVFQQAQMNLFYAIHQTAASMPVPGVAETDVTKKPATLCRRQSFEQSPRRVSEKIC